MSVPPKSISLHLLPLDAIDTHPVERQLRTMLVVQPGDQHISGRRIDHVAD